MSVQVAVQYVLSEGKSDAFARLIIFPLINSE